MTEQETFDFVARKIIEQGEPSITETGACRYRLVKEDGRVLKCAAGHLIPDEDYNLGMEGTNITDLRFHKPLSHLNLLNEMQRAHDGRASGGDRFVEFFKARMAMIAQDHGLNADVLK